MRLVPPLLRRNLVWLCWSHCLFVHFTTFLYGTMTSPNFWCLGIYGQSCRRMIMYCKRVSPHSPPSGQSLTKTVFGVVPSSVSSLPFQATTPGCSYGEREGTVRVGETGSRLVDPMYTKNYMTIQILLTYFYSLSPSIDDAI